jgi:pimeloyl-ACP methyl ester carboxylesterase
MQPPGDYSIEMMAKDVAALMEAIHIERAFVAGHSMGGLVAMQLTHAFPDRVQALILLDTTATWNQGLFAYFMWLYPYWVRIKNRLVGWEQENRNRANSFTRHEVEPQYHEWIYQRRDLNQIEPFIASWRAIINFNAERFLPNIHQPTLIICGEDDDLVPPVFREQLNELIPQSTLRIIPSPARHYPQIQFAGQVNEALLTFLNQHPMLSDTTSEALKDPN